MNHRYDPLKVKNKYFLAWAKSTGMKKGDSYANWQYINWITDRHEEFRQETGLLGHEDGYAEAFVNWIESNYNEPS